MILPRTGRQIGLAAALACVYFVAAKLGLRLAFFHPSATPVWPPTGIALAAFPLAGYEVWPGIFLGAFAATLTTVGTVWTSLGIASGNTLEGAVGAYLVTRYAGGAPGVRPAARRWSAWVSSARFSRAPGLCSGARFRSASC